MVNEVQRPVFAEGQILGADQLNSATDYGRARQGRHDRFHHSWGITYGLALIPEDRTNEQGVDFQRITLQPGVAVDGNGRAIVVTEPTTLEPVTFVLSGVAAPTKPGEEPPWHPVFLVGIDQDAPVSPFQAGSCSEALASSKVEGYQIQYGRPGEESGPEEMPVAGVLEGAGTDAPRKTWRVLLGYVQWNAQITQFIAVADRVKGNPIARRYAGVRADQVEAQGGRLSLRARADGNPGKPVVVIDEDVEGQGELSFGLDNGKGSITKVFKINALGDVQAEGTIIGAVARGSVFVQAGTANDGVTLPLPFGITEEQVENDQVQLLWHVTPTVDKFARPAGGDPVEWAAFPLECFVDGDRRIHCALRWMQVRNVTAGPPPVFDLPAACDYMVLAAVPASKGATP